MKQEQKTNNEAQKNSLVVEATKSPFKTAFKATLGVFAAYILVGVTFAFASLGVLWLIGFIVSH